MRERFDRYFGRVEVGIYSTLALLLSVTVIAGIASAGKLLWDALSGWTLATQTLRVLNELLVVLMLVLSRIDYAWFRLHMRVLYGLLIVSILAVLAAGHTARGSQRAINLSFFSFQASELGKVLLTVALAAFVVGRARRLYQLTPPRASTLEMFPYPFPANLGISSVPRPIYQ